MFELNGAEMIGPNDWSFDLLLL